MRKSLDIDIKIREISREANVKTKEKVIEILYLKPNISNKDIANILVVTIKSVEYHKSNIR
jgi:predicted transcriptional regulator